MAFELPPIIKDHPYATGSIVIVGGIVILYLLSGSSSSTSGPASNQAAILQADEAEAQINAGTQQQDAQTSAELQAAQDQQESTDKQTDASVAINNDQTAAQLAAAIVGTTATTTQQANAEISNENVYAMQESELEDQINSGVVENANNNATAVAGSEIAAGVDTTALGDSLTLATQQEHDAYNLENEDETAYDAEIPYIVQNAGDQKNSLIDATDQTSLFQTILAKGNPSVAAAGTGAASSADKVAGSTVLTGGNVVSLTNAGGSLLTGLFG